MRAQAWTTVSDAGEVGRRQPAQRPTIAQRAVFLNHVHTEIKALAGVLVLPVHTFCQQTDVSGAPRQGFTRGLCIKSPAKGSRRPRGGRSGDRIRPLTVSKITSLWLARRGVGHAAPGPARRSAGPFRPATPDPRARWTS